MKRRTGSGDEGTTGLVGGRRVRKDSAVIEALGAIDEAAAVIGLARSAVEDEARARVLYECQAALQECAAAIARPPDEPHCDFDFAAATGQLEDRMREIGKTAGEPAGFVIAGNCATEAALNVARTVVRRAERRVVALKPAGAAARDGVAAYLNRLSDFLFYMACREAAEKVA